MTEEKKPELIEDEALDEAAGGSLPRMQKVHDPSVPTSSSTAYKGATPVIQGVVNAAGDGSV